MSPFFLEIKSMLSGGMGTAIMIIMLAFIIVLLVEFVKGSRKTDMRELFIDERSKHFSHTKYWSNVAYLVATVTFLYMHLYAIDKIADQLEMLWLIYLGVVAGNASVNKLISYKYGAQKSAEEHSYARYESPPPRYGAGPVMRPPVVRPPVTRPGAPIDDEFEDDIEPRRR